MPTLLHLLSLVLALTTGGVSQALAFVVSGQDGCAEVSLHDEEGSDEGADCCTDCAPQCDACVHCRVRANVGTAWVLPSPIPRGSEAVDRAPLEPVMSAPGVDIFQPPRA